MSDRPGSDRPWRVLSVVSLGTVLVVLNTTALSVGLPVVVRHFGAGAFASSWLVLALVLTETALLIVFGRLADVVGRRGVYLLGFAVFTLAALLAGFAPSIGLLIAVRVLQGAGAAMILANGTAIVAHAFPPERLSQGMGVYLGVMAAAPLIGPSLGGYLATAYGWQWVFWFNVPVGLVAMAWALLSLPKVPPGAREPIDLAGAALLAGWLGGLMLLLSEGGSTGWTTPPAVGGGIAFAVLMPLFALRQFKAAAPLVDLRLLRDRSFTLANIAAFCNVLGWVGVSILMALYLQTVQGMSPAAAGLAVLPGPIASMVTTPFAGQLAARIEPRAVAVGGAAVAALGLLVLMVMLGETTPYAWIALGLVLCAAGSSVFYTANTTSIMLEVPRERLGVVNGLRLTLHNLGISLSTAVSLTLVVSAMPIADRHLLYTGDAAGAALDALLRGYHRAFAVLFALQVLTVAVATVSFRHRRALSSRLGDLKVNSSPALRRETSDVAE